MKKSFILVTVVALLVMLAPGCAPEEAQAPGPETTPTAEWGIIEIRVTDPPPADVIHAFVTLTNIEVHREEGAWQTLDLRDTSGNIIAEATFDLMEVLEVTEVLGSANVTAGSFTQIRMDVAEVAVVFVTDNTTDPVTTDNVTARVPSEKLRIVKAFEVVAGEKTVLTLDFDGEKSLILPGKDIDTGKERAIFKPVVRLKAEHSSPPAKGADTSPPLTGQTGEDTTPPVISVIGVADGQQYSGPVTPVISVSDDEPDPTVTVTLNGKPFISGTVVDQVGEYELETTATDASGNEAEVTIAFEIVESE